MKVGNLKVEVRSESAVWMELEIQFELAVWMELEIQFEKGMSDLIDSLEPNDPRCCWKTLCL